MASYVLTTCIDCCVEQLYESISSSSGSGGILPEVSIFALVSNKLAMMIHQSHSIPGQMDQIL